MNDMHRVIRIKFKNSGRIYFFDAGTLNIKKGQGVVVDTARGNMLGEAVSDVEEMTDEQLVAPLKSVIRLAIDDDYEQEAYYRSREAEAAEICAKKIAEHGLGMKLVDVEYAYNGTKLTFFFTADTRVDFRELLKDLTSVFKTRIDLRQIGDRDEAKKCGGLGICGRAVCCNSFLQEFAPVSIKMAKTQNLSLNPIKISGICGKLMCCLRYEQEGYESMQKLMPKVGREYTTPDGVGVVLENNAISETTKLKVTLADGTFDIRSYPFRELEPAESNPAAENAKPSEASSEDENPGAAERPEAPAAVNGKNGEQESPKAATEPANGGGNGNKGNNKRPGGRRNFYKARPNGNKPNPNAGKKPGEE